MELTTNSNQTSNPFSKLDLQTINELLFAIENRFEYHRDEKSGDVQKDFRKHYSLYLSLISYVNSNFEEIKINHPQMSAFGFAKIVQGILIIIKRELESGK